MGVVRWNGHSFMTPKTQFNLDTRTISCTLEDGMEIDLWDRLMKNEMKPICPECGAQFPWTSLNRVVETSLDVFAEPLMTSMAIARCPHCGKTVHTEMITFGYPFYSVEYAVRFVLEKMKMAADSVQELEERGESNGKKVEGSCQ